MYLTDSVTWKFLTTTIKESEGKSSELKFIELCETGKNMGSLYFQSAANFVRKIYEMGIKNNG